MSAERERSGPTAKELRDEVARVAASARSVVLIEAPRGTPVAEIANAVHARSQRAAFPFVELAPLDASPADLRDALARAGHGTLFLPDLSRSSAETQAALASQLEARFAGATPLRSRLVAALIHGDDEARTRAAVREDLLYRLNGAVLRLRPLRERRDELAALIRGRVGADCTARAEAALLDYDWPGNERELELVLERAHLLADGGPIDSVHLALSGTKESDALDDALPMTDRSLRSMEAALIRRVLAEQGGNKSRAAEILGLHRATLHQKLRAFRCQGLLEREPQRPDRCRARDANGQ